MSWPISYERDTISRASSNFFGLARSGLTPHYYEQTMRRRMVARASETHRADTAEVYGCRRGPTIARGVLAPSLLPPHQPRLTEMDTSTR